jgi:hypothetical protein
VIQPDKKIVAAGYTGTGTGTDALCAPPLTSGDLPRALARERVQQRG